MVVINVVLAGVTGTGKSTTGNVLLGQDRQAHFITSSSSASETQECQTRSCTVGGHEIRIIDTPGFSDTDKSPEELLDAFAHFKDWASEGVHAFIFTVRAGRFTHEHDAAMRAFTEALSPQALQRTILTVTCFDSSSWNSLQHFLCSSNSMLQEWQQMVSCCIGIENLEASGQAREAILKAVFQVAQAQTPYSNHHLDEAKLWRQQFWLRIQQLQVQLSVSQASEALRNVAEGRWTRRQAELELGNLEVNQKHVQSIERQKVANARSAQIESQQRRQAQEQLHRDNLERTRQQRDMEQMVARVQTESQQQRLRQRSEEARCQREQLALQQQLQQQETSVAEARRRLETRPQVIYVERQPQQQPAVDHVGRGAGFGSLIGGVAGLLLGGPTLAQAGAKIGAGIGETVGHGRAMEESQREQ